VRSKVLGSLKSQEVIMFTTTSMGRKGEYYVMYVPKEVGEEVRKAIEEGKEMLVIIIVKEREREREEKKRGNRGKVSVQITALPFSP